MRVYCKFSDITGIGYRCDLGYELDEEPWCPHRYLTRTIMLRDPKNNDAFLVPLPREFDLQNVANAIQPMALADIPIVCEFPGVFVDELLGLPPDRDIEFKTELIPGTTPVS